MENNKKNVLQIDIDQLDLEWLQQPIKYMKYAEEAERLKIEKEALKADLDEQARISMENAGIKISEAKVDAWINRNNTYQELSLELALAQSMVKALDQKKYALQDLVQLWLGGYYSTPSVKEQHTIEQNRAEKIAADQRRKLNKKE